MDQIIGEPVDQLELGPMEWLDTERALFGEGDEGPRLNCNTFLARWGDRIGFCCQSDDATFLYLDDEAEEDEVMKPVWRVVREPDQILVPILSTPSPPDLVDALVAAEAAILNCHGSRSHNHHAALRKIRAALAAAPAVGEPETRGG